ncbi:MAG: hypothetical protein KIT27_04355 [Legionellales bacterium]|nr:hypothetical protein [Legionellales bacterium]
MQDISDSFKTNHSNTYNRRYQIIKHTYLNSEPEISLFDNELLTDKELVLTQLIDQDEILINLSANDIRSLMSMWAEHFIKREREDIKNIKN